MFEGVRPFHIIEPYAAATAVSKGERPEMNAKTYPPYMKEYVHTFLPYFNRVKSI
jgi:hypothetical protein